jgi:hypothetical protein
LDPKWLQRSRHPLEESPEHFQPKDIAAFEEIIQEGHCIVFSREKRIVVMCGI